MKRTVSVPGSHFPARVYEGVSLTGAAERWLDDTFPSDMTLWAAFQRRMDGAEIVVRSENGSEAAVFGVFLDPRGLLRVGLKRWRKVAP